MTTVPRETLPGPAVQPARELARVTKRREEKPGYYRLRMHAPGIAGGARAGQFVHLLPRLTEDESTSADNVQTFDPFLRRAFSVMKCEGDEFEVLFRTGGRGTTMLSQRRPGEIVDALGPLGGGFGMFAAHNLLVGGGVGVPPLVMLATRAVKENAAVTALIGARSENDLLCEADFAALNAPVETATEDGSAGEQGRVTRLLARHLEAVNPQAAKIFACGPLPMLRAVAELCLQRGAACEVSLEEAMPCGVGVCNGCVVPVHGEGDDYGRYRRICIEGPVLDARSVDWARL